MSNRALTAALVMLLLASFGYPAYAGDAGPARAGTPAMNPDRVIRITDSTRYINVEPNETVRLIIVDAQGKETSFDWRVEQFDKYVFPLSDIAPKSFVGGRSIQVYIQREAPASY
jgi:hypothetical protein